jgi:ribosomal peptide maturation radical SAM protein 1
MKIVLVSMPWNLLETPSLPLGLLRARARASKHPAAITDYYGNLRWAEHLLERSGGAITPEDYSYIANWGVWHGMGDWVFAGVLSGQPDFHAADYPGYLARQRTEPGKSAVMRDYAADFIVQAAQEILAQEPDLVGFSSTFQQNVPSLALARQLKHEQPSLPVLFGGGNCELPMGPALHRNFAFIDYVVSGEAEIAFVALLDALSGEREIASVPGLTWRGPDGGSVFNGPAGMVPVDLVPSPDYSGWFDALRLSPVRDHVQPKLLFEAARGCWWGEKHQCTFCGLNGSTMQFRAKSADAVWDALGDLVTRHQVLDIVMVENIMDKRHARELLPRIKDAGWDLRLYYEVKANLRSDQLALFSEAGVSHIQPGIESLSTRVLALMDKGVHATQNIQVLRDCECNQLTVDWNFLYGFPGEADADYQPVIEQIPALVHLQPPAGATRIILERFSPYFERPELGFAERRAAEFYQYLYDLPPSEIFDIGYQFRTPAHGITGATEEALRAQVRRWHDSYPASSLVYARDGEAVHIYDARAGWPRQRITIGQPELAAAYLLLMTPRTVTGLLRRLADQGIEVGEREIGGWLSWARTAGLVFEDGGRIVALATDRLPVRAPLSLLDDDRRAGVSVR